MNENLMLEILQVNAEANTQLNVGGEYDLAGKMHEFGKGSYSTVFLVKGLVTRVLYSQTWDNAGDTLVLTDTCCMKVLTNPTNLPDDTLMKRATREYELLLATSCKQRPTPTPIALGVLHSGSGIQPAILMDNAWPETPWLYTLSLKDIGSILGRGITFERLSFAARLGVHLCASLACIHECGVVVRDLKPDNILIHLQAVPGWPIIEHVTILDLGSAGQIGESDEPFDARNLSLASHIYGAPEIFDFNIDNSGTIIPGELYKYRNSLAPDIWSLGTILYHVATDIDPDFAPTIIDGEEAILQDNKQRQMQWADQVCSYMPHLKLTEPEAPTYYDTLQAIIRLCCTFDPEKRMEQASLDAIKSRLNDLPAPSIQAREQNCDRRIAPSEVALDDFTRLLEFSEFLGVGMAELRHFMQVFGLELTGPRAMSLDQLFAIKSLVGSRRAAAPAPWRAQPR